MADVTTKIIVFALLQHCSAEISNNAQGAWYSANVINDPSYSPRPLTDIFSTQSPFSSSNPIVVLPTTNNPVKQAQTASTTDPTTFQSTSVPPTTNAPANPPTIIAIPDASSNPNQTNVLLFYQQAPQTFQNLNSDNQFKQQILQQQIAQQQNAPTPFSVPTSQAPIIIAASDNEQTTPNPNGPFTAQITSLNAQTPTFLAQVMNPGQNLNIPPLNPPNPNFIGPNTNFPNGQNPIFNGPFPSNPNANFNGQNFPNGPNVNFNGQFPNFPNGPNPNFNFQNFPNGPNPNFNGPNPNFPNINVQNPNFLNNNLQNANIINANGQNPTLPTATGPTPNPPVVNGQSPTLAPTTGANLAIGPVLTNGTQNATLPNIRIRLVSPTGTITNVNIQGTGSTVRPRTTTRRNQRNNVDSCVNACGGTRTPICAAPLAVRPINPNDLKGFPSTCHLACNNSFRRNLYEKVIDGRCGRLRTRIRTLDAADRLRRPDLNRNQYTIVQNPGTVIEFSPMNQ